MIFKILWLYCITYNIIKINFTSFFAFNFVTGRFHIPRVAGIIQSLLKMSFY